MKVETDKFQDEVCCVVAQIPYGKVLTYGQVAYLAGKPRNSRQTGHILSTFSASLNLPCHRVVNSLGRTAPCFSEQRTFLEAEGITFKPNGCVDMRKHQWHFEEEI